MKSRPDDGTPPSVLIDARIAGLGDWRGALLAQLRRAIDLPEGGALDGPALKTLFAAAAALNAVGLKKR